MARRELLLLTWALAACGGEPEPTNTALVRGFEPRPLSVLAAGWEQGGDGRTQLLPGNPGLELNRPVASEEWTPDGTGDGYRLALPGGAWKRSGVVPRLAGRGREFQRASSGAELAVGEFRIEGTRLTLRQNPEQNVVPRTLLRLQPESGAALELPLPSTAWRTAELGGAFWLEHPRLATDGARLFAELVRVEGDQPLSPFTYRFDGAALRLCHPDSAPPPMLLVGRLENGRVVNGEWQLRLGRVCATGIPVWSGESESLTGSIPGGSELWFRFLHNSCAGEVRARVSLDGETVFDERFPAQDRREPKSVRVGLPAREHARLTFAVEGADGLGAFFTPRLVPREHATPLERTAPTRPDLLVVLVDTLRADSLELAGGSPELAPNLNRFARECRVFPNARSNAAWTLPSISSLLTGLHPGQHGATDEDLSLSSFHTTIAERLAEAGYRTGAITDGSFFAPIFGLDQGFEWFSEHNPPHWDLDRTVAEAQSFLEEDDGRPVFLVVHTYRVHQPYRVGPEEDGRAYEAVMARARAAAGARIPTPKEGLALLMPHADELRTLYHEGVRDLDRALGGFLAWLERRRFFEHGTLILTSDHGENLGENHDFFHGGHLWETKLRVPLLLRGPGLEARSEPHLVGPIDLAPTLADLAGIPADPRWVGSSLLTLASARPAYAFQLTPKSRLVAYREAERKLIFAPVSGGPGGEAFDLASDPREEENLAGTSAWPAELRQRLDPELSRYLEALAPSERAGVTPELRNQLDGLGYGGETSEE